MNHDISLIIGKGIQKASKRHSIRRIGNYGAGARKVKTFLHMNDTREAKGFDTHLIRSNDLSILLSTTGSRVRKADTDTGVAD
jgi:hypothetical protein